MLILGEFILRRFGISKFNAFLGMNRFSFFFFKILYPSFTVSIVAMISLLGNVLEIRPFARRSVPMWVNCGEDILITNFFLSAMLVGGQDKFLDLVNLVITTYWYIFNSRFYQKLMALH